MYRFSLRTRIYLSMIAILLLSFIITGVVALYHDLKQNQEFNQQRLERKEKSVRASLDYFLNHEGGHMNPDSVSYKFGDKICELADVHDMFIGLFALDGEYLISNNSAYLDTLEIPKEVPSEVLNQIQTGENKKCVWDHYTHENYTLAYWLFKDLDGEPIAVIAMDYSNIDEDPKDIKDFFIGIIGSYILLFFIGAATAFLLSRYITRSLNKIADKIKSTNFTESFTELQWEGNDEIGHLVKEYNKMLVALKKSADQLAEREREGAWREMAQQIAHDIKNPLTPMRLRVQHLQRQYEQNDPEEFKKQLKSFIQTMTEQVDSLANIANAFSQFAKTEKNKFISLNLAEKIKSIATLFQSEQCEISVIPTKKECLIFTDSLDIERTFTNLFTNSIQAQQTDKKMLITVEMRVFKNFLYVVINDNGIGIPKESLHRLFQPRFTTKSNGTGLGLATVKTLVEWSGGMIKCKSQLHVGTRMMIRYPISIDAMDTK
jgi:two-component system, NtrC family, nitrogen regulation sensor histidine kinase NtrY